jgi:hypothetical protein
MPALHACAACLRCMPAQAPVAPALAIGCLDATYGLCACEWQHPHTSACTSVLCHQQTRKNPFQGLVSPCPAKDVRVPTPPCHAADMHTLSLCCLACFVQTRSTNQTASECCWWWQLLHSSLVMRSCMQHRDSHEVWSDCVCSANKL